LEVTTAASALWVFKKAIKYYFYCYWKKIISTQTFLKAFLNLEICTYKILIFTSGSGHAQLFFILFTFYTKVRLFRMRLIVMG